MLYKYKAVDDKGINKEGEIDAPNRDMAISGLQRRGLVVVSIKENTGQKPFLNRSLFERVTMKELVILSRQIATLFEAQVSALKIFTMLSQNEDNPILSRKLNVISQDLQAGVSISGALAKHKDVFSDFYINMVKAGEESGELNKAFLHLSEYLDRQYAVTSKTRNALIYPAFVIVTFIAVVILMFVFVIPKLATIILDSGQEVPFFTKIVIGFSDFLVNYGILVLAFVAGAGIIVWQISRTLQGKINIDRYRLSVPIIGNLFQKLYLSRIADNMDTMLVSGIPMIRSIDITSDVVNSYIYKDILKNVAENVKAGLSLSASFEKYPEYVPAIFVQMVKVGEETGSLGQILKTLSDFYKREVDDAVDTMVSLIEPIMIVVLGLGVGILLTSVLIPIYSMAGAIS